MRRFRLLDTLALGVFVLLVPVTASAQWFDYRTPGIPRLPDGKPNLSAPRLELLTANRISPAYGEGPGRYIGSTLPRISTRRTFSLGRNSYSCSECAIHARTVRLPAACR
jgi:hypothetical protein